MLVLRAFRDAGGVSAGSPRLQTGGLQVCLWQTSSAQSCGLRLGASQPSSGGAVVKAAVRVPSGVPPFLFLSLSGFPLGAGRKGSVVGGTQRAFSSRRTGAESPGRAFALAARKPGAGRGRWAGPPRGGRGSGRRAFPPPATPVSLWSGKKASHKTANKKRLSVAQTSPFRKNWLFRAL